MADSQHSFTKLKSFLSNPVVFYDGVIASVDREELQICLYSSKAFDSVSTTSSPQNWTDTDMIARKYKIIRKMWTNI